MQKTKRQMKRIGVGLVGGIVLFVGIIAIPYPGPGWLIVFAGLGILATEFVWAQRVLTYARGKYDGWQHWIKFQPLSIRILLIVLTGLVVVLTIYLLNGYGLIDNWLQLHQLWVHSPIHI
jgi:uncharacterized protein (TIGR02611 family)